MDKSEETVRAELRTLVAREIAAEYAAEVESDFAREVPEPDSGQSQEDFVLSSRDWYGMIPLPTFSKHHAPGGTLEERDEREKALHKEMMNQLVTQKAEIETQAEILADIKKKKANEKRKQEQRQREKNLKQQAIKEDMRKHIIVEASKPVADYKTEL